MSLERVIKKIRRKEIILWTGAGFNSVAGLLSGRELARTIKNQCTEPEREMLNSIGDLLPEIAEEFVRMRSGTRQELHQIVTEALTPEEPDLTVHGYVKDIPQIKTIITTNYDDLFERAFDERISVIAKDSDVTRSTTKPRLFKIHGDIRDIDRIVITKKDYRSWFRDFHISALWNTVYSHMAAKSILFVGYGFGDPNIWYLFEQLIEILGDARRESFLVAPSVPDHVKTSLGKLGVTVIGRSAEDALKEVRDSIVGHLIEDCEAGLVDPEHIQPVLERHGISTKWEIKDGTKHIVNFGSKNQESSQPHNITLWLPQDTAEQFQEFMSQREPGELELSQGSISCIDSHINGVSMPPFGDAKQLKLVIQDRPRRDFKGLLMVRGVKTASVPISAKIYARSEVIRTEIDGPGFKSTFEFDLKTRLATSNLQHGVSGDPAELLASAEVLHEWLSGAKAHLSDPKSGLLIPLPQVPGTDEEVEELRSLLNARVQFYSEILAVSSHFNVYVKVPEQIDDDDLDILDQVIGAMNGQKWKVPKVELSMVPESYEGLEERLLQGGPKPIRNVGNEPEIVNFFGTELELGYPVIETTDGVIVNEDEVRKAIRDRSESVCLVIKSASDEMFFYFREQHPAHQNGDDGGGEE